MYQVLQMDGKTDFEPGDHLSLSGAVKVSKYLNDYLKSHYDLADHRGDSYYQRWDRNSEYMRHKIYDYRDDEVE